MRILRLDHVALRRGDPLLRRGQPARVGHPLVEQRLILRLGDPDLAGLVFDFLQCGRDFRGRRVDLALRLLHTRRNRRPRVLPGTLTRVAQRDAQLLRNGPHDAVERQGDREHRIADVGAAIRHHSHPFS